MLAVVNFEFNFNQILNKLNSNSELIFEKFVSNVSQISLSYSFAQTTSNQAFSKPKSRPPAPAKNDTTFIILEINLFNNKLTKLKHLGQIMGAKIGQPITSILRNGGFSSLYDSFVVSSSAVLRLNFCAKNPPLRQAANRQDVKKLQFTTHQPFF